MTAFHFRCSRCGRGYQAGDLYTCPADGANLDVELDLDALRARLRPADLAAGAEPSLWRYLPLLPVADPGFQGTAFRSVGWTPLLSPPGLRAHSGLSQLWFKDDGRNPTASFKDRASAVVLARARETGAQVVITASTGNAGAALAGLGAAVGLPTVILAPRTAPEAKVAQLLVYGARVVLVDGTYDDAFDLSLEAARTFGWLCRNTGFNPLTAEGKKTAAFEVCEQMSPPGAARWEAPEAVFVSVGDGNIITGLHKGFRDLQALGWIERLPRLYGVQSTGSDAVCRAFVAGEEEATPVRARTVADSIAVDLPRDGRRALRAMRETGGACLAVPDEAILEAIQVLGARGALFAEPAAAAAYAGLLQAAERGLVGRDERVVVIITGSGLKDVRAACRAVGEAPVIPPDLARLREVVRDVQ